jgi:hypothetical protein
VLSSLLLTDHQPRQPIGEEGFQPVSLTDDPLIVEPIHEIAAVQRQCCLQTSFVVLGYLRLELIDIHPQIALGINLHGVEIAHKEPFFGEAAADMP